MSYSRKTLPANHRLREAEVPSESAHFGAKEICAHTKQCPKGHEPSVPATSCVLYRASRAFAERDSTSHSPAQSDPSPYASGSQGARPGSLPQHGSPHTSSLQKFVRRGWHRLSVRNIGVT